MAVVVLKIVMCAAKQREMIMAKALFFANDLKVRSKGKFLIIKARRKYQYGTDT